MTDTVSRRAVLGALGAGALLPACAAALTFPAHTVPAGSRELWTWVRAQLVLDPGVAWFDTAGCGPALRAVMVREYRSRERQSADFPAYQATALGPGPLHLHLAAVGAFLGAEADEIAFTTGSAEALGTLARALELQFGDQVLAGAGERPAALGAWRIEAARHRFELVELPPDAAPPTPEAIVDRYAAAITPRTRALLLSHVRASDGTILPVREICSMARARGIFTVVDGALAAGHLDFRLADLGCDAYATAFHRWLNASWGIGALYVRRDAQARLWPTTETADGIAGVQGRYGTTYRYLGPAIEGVRVALEFQEAVSRARIGARIRELTSYLRQQLATLPAAGIVTPSHPALASGIVAVRLPGRDHAAIARALAHEDRIVVAAVGQGPQEALRISVHPGNDHAQIDGCVDALRRHA